MLLYKLLHHFPFAKLIEWKLPSLTTDTVSFCQIENDVKVCKVTNVETDEENKKIIVNFERESKAKRNKSTLKYQNRFFISFVNFQIEEDLLV